MQYRNIGAHKHHHTIPLKQFDVWINDKKVLRTFRCNVIGCDHTWRKNIREPRPKGK